MVEHTVTREPSPHWVDKGAYWHLNAGHAGAVVWKREPSWDVHTRGFCVDMGDATSVDAAKIAAEDVLIGMASEMLKAVGHA